MVAVKNVTNVSFYRSLNTKHEHSSRLVFATGGDNDIPGFNERELLLFYIFLRAGTRHAMAIVILSLFFG